ncbi:hypothetical protein DBR11_12215 [Pedobacter sp. HMWF019]|uniref:fasciclin domain-containing protein n=1 Tax=Pedobacter sp. HMWF019 TaxID=2056856 RepID=UPI000D379E13|nr:fasciclin domain-containing protein [Pedobacter sp. HMWF019]PTS99493.1 hypothetical protein DBR11_12215 [Pedobacter sp. HMWF019]
MKNIKKLMIPAIVLSCLAFAACEKLPLQKNDKYTPSYYDNKVNMNVMEFMNSRKDMFSGMLSAIDYVDKDPAYKDVKQMYSSTGNTFLLMHNNALVNLEDGNSFFVKNTVLDKDPASPSYNTPIRGSDWSQYDRKIVADLLRYHVLKGTYDFKSLNSVGRWVDSYALSPTNDSAKVYIYMQATREGYLFINNYVGTSMVEIRPRTPDLHATNGVIHVMNRYFVMPTRKDISNNK